MTNPTPGTPLPWEVDTIQSEGEYGTGPDTHVGFAVSAIYDAKGNVLFDALNSDVIVVHEDYGDEDGYVSAWDETSAKNACYLVHTANSYPALVALKDELVAMLQTCRGELRTMGELTDGLASEDCAALVAKIDALLAKARGEG